MSSKFSQKLGSKKKNYFWASQIDSRYGFDNDIRFFLGFSLFDNYLISPICFIMMNALQARNIIIYYNTHRYIGQ
jgi:hypothetical protein